MSFDVPISLVQDAVLYFRRYFFQNRGCQGLLCAFTFHYQDHSRFTLVNSFNFPETILA